MNLQLQELLQSNRKPGFVLTKATETDCPVTEQVLTDIIPTRQAAIKLAQTFPYAVRVQQASAVSVSNELPTSDVSLQGLWAQMVKGE